MRILNLLPKGFLIKLLSLLLLAAPPNADAVNFTLEDQTLAGSATTVTVPIKVSDFADVGAMQFTLSWDPAVLTYKSLGDFNHSTSFTELLAFGETHFNVTDVANGKLNCLYEQVLSSDVTLSDNETIFSITFDVVGGDGSSSSVAFVDDPTPRKLASFFAQTPDFVSQNATIQIGAQTDSTTPGTVGRRTASGTGPAARTSSSDSALP